MKKLLYSALAIAFVSSCNHGNKDAEQLPPIELRARTDTVIGFGDYLLGDTILQDRYTVGDPIPIQIATANRTIDCNYHTFRTQCISKEVEEPQKTNRRSRDTTCVAEVANHKLDSVIINDIYVHTKYNNDTTLVHEIIDLYSSRYGAPSYFKENGADNVIFFSDNATYQRIISQFVLGDEGPLPGKLIWEWANCSIEMYVGGGTTFNIVYEDYGYRKRIALEEEKRISKKLRKYKTVGQ